MVELEIDREDIRTRKDWRRNAINRIGNMLYNVIHDINIQLSLNYVSRDKHTQPQYRGHFWPRPETDNIYLINK